MPAFRLRRVSTPVSFQGLVYWLFCSSKHTVITVTSALSLLIGASVGELSAGDPARHAAFAACAALMMAAIAIAAWLVRAGNAISFFSETVLVGFKAGLALYLASTQLPKLFGFKGTHGDFWERSAHFISHLGETHEISLLVGVIAFVALVAGKLWLKNRPVAFLVVVAGMLAARFMDLETQGVALLGQVPQGLPALGLPAVSRQEMNDLLPSRWLASFSPLSRRPRSAGCLARSTATGSTPTRSSWRSALPICSRDSVEDSR